ncbi:MAG: mercuric transporter MerT family protein, partial [Thermoanaerobaculia bacterium]
SRSWVLTGAVLSALGASACCILPVAVAVLGVGSAAVAASLEPLRPLFLAATAVLLGLAFRRAYRTADCGPGGSCSPPPSRRRFRIVLWIAAALAVALLAFPYYADLLL